MKINLQPKSSNLWTSLAIVIGSLFMGFQEELAREAAAAVMGVIAAAQGIREWIKQYGLKPDIPGAVNGSNLWAYLGVVITGFLPMLPVDFVDTIEALAKNILGGNFQGILFSAFALLTILYNVFIRKQPAKA